MYTPKKSSRFQLAVAFTAEVRANQKLNTDLARGGSSVFWITSSNWSYMSFHLSYTPDLQSDTQTTTPSKYFSHTMGSRKNVFTELPVLILSIRVCLRNDSAISSQSSSCWRVGKGVNSLSVDNEIKSLYTLMKTWHSPSAELCRQAQCRHQQQKVKGDSADVFSHASSAPILIQQPATVSGFGHVLGKHSNLLTPGGICTNSLTLRLYRTVKCCCSRTPKHQQAKERKAKRSSWVLERLEIKGPLDTCYWHKHQNDVIPENNHNSKRRGVFT